MQEDIKKAEQYFSSGEFETGFDYLKKQNDKDLNEKLAPEILDAVKKFYFGFKDEFEGSENESWLNDKIEELKNVASEMKELELDFEAIKEGINNHCKHINETLSLGTSAVYYNNRIEGTSIVFSSPYSYNSDITYSIRTNVDYTLKNKIMDELSIATIGGDFNVKDLIKELTDKFVN